jgi:DNA polymerase
MSYSIDGGPIQTWKPGEVLPMVTDPLIAHNAAFDSAIWEHVMRPKYGAGVFSEWQCTSSLAAFFGLPRALQRALEALGGDGKDLEGSKVMLKYAKDPSREIPQEDLDTIVKYCERDVEAMIELTTLLPHPKLPVTEQAVYELDQKINRRGIPIDVEACAVATVEVAEMKAAANRRIEELSGGAVRTINQRAKFLEWLKGEGVELPNLRAETVRDVLATGEVTGKALEALQLRQEAGLNSLSKFTSLMDRTCEDGRARGSHLYFGAHTGRWSSRGVQFQNVPRGDLKDPEATIESMMVPGHSGLSSRELQGIIRGMVKAEDGKEFAVADFGQIEARVLAWCARQYDLLDEFRSGKDVYVEMSKAIYDKEEISKDERFFGKSAVLGFGYGMGAPKFRTTLEKQGVIIDEAFAVKCRDAYRSKNDRIKAFWYDLDRTVKEAIDTSEKHDLPRELREVWVQNDSFAAKVEGDFLKILIPSGRCLWYFKPALIEEYNAAFDKEMEQITYLTQSSVTRRFEQTRTYGGKLTENVVQALARDVLVHSMRALDRAGYDIVMTVHDEIVIEGADLDLGDVERIMSTPPSWCADLPLTVDGFKAERFRK